MRSNLPILALWVLVLESAFGCEARSRGSAPLNGAMVLALDQDAQLAGAAAEADSKDGPLQPAEPEPEPAEVDPYAGWQHRCEPLDGARFCKTSKDCAKVQHPSGKTLKCVKPWWSEQRADGTWTRVCSPGWSNRTERRWRRARLREIVRQQYFEEPERCEDDERPAHKQPWRCQREQHRGNTLTKFLWLVYQRETTGRPWKRHRLNGDVRVAKTDWFRQAPRYGWWALTTKHGDFQRMIPCQKVPQRSSDSRSLQACREREPSRHFPHQYRWSFGLGPYGQIAALWVAGWDPKAPPEVLCGEVESTETYLRGARRAWRKLRGGIKCHGELYKPEVTWAILHRAVAGGKLCPGKKSEGFRRRARGLGLDPDQVVTLNMLGNPIGRDGQNARASELYAVVDTEFPSPDMLEP